MTCCGENMNKCKEGKRHYWKSGWVCEKCGLKRWELDESSRRKKIQLRDVEYFVELLTFHESEILKQIDETTNGLLLSALYQELDKCRGSFSRIIESK